MTAVARRRPKKAVSPTTQAEPPATVERAPVTPSPGKNALFWAMREELVTTAPQRVVLAVMADHWNPNRHCVWLGHKAISKQTRLSVTAVKNALTGLRAAGIVEWREMRLRDHQGRDGSPNCYLFPTFDPAAPVPPDYFVLQESARGGARRRASEVTGQSPRDAASGGSKPKLSLLSPQAGSTADYEVPLDAPIEVHREGATTSDGLRRPTKTLNRTSSPAARHSLANVARPALSRAASNALGARNPAAERGDTAHGCAQRLKWGLTQYAEDYPDPVNVKVLTVTLRRWVEDGIEVATVREMVDTFVDTPAKYIAGDDVPWRCFINARQKLLTDARRRLTGRGQLALGLREMTATPASSSKANLRDLLTNNSKGPT